MALAVALAGATPDMTHAHTGPHHTTTPETSAHNTPATIPIPHVRGMLRSEFMHTILNETRSTNRKLILSVIAQSLSGLYESFPRHKRDIDVFLERYNEFVIRLFHANDTNTLMPDTKILNEAQQLADEGEALLLSLDPHRP